MSLGLPFFFFFLVMKMRLSKISCPVQRSVLRDAVLFADLQSLICRLLCSCLETEKVRKRVEVASRLWEENCRSSFSFGCSSIDLLDSFGLVKVGHICWGHAARKQIKFQLQGLVCRSMSAECAWDKHCLGRRNTRNSTQEIHSPHAVSL